MPLTNNDIEQLATWCAGSGVLADIRLKARSMFFGYDEPGTINYLADSGEENGRERRFLGWFAFGFKLPDGRHPAELAANDLLYGAKLASALIAIPEAKYFTAIVTFVISGKSVFLELENKEFEIGSRILSQVLHEDDVLCAHLIPVGIPGRRGRWVVGPGWLVWPTRFGPGIRAQLKKFQLDPIQVERFLQQRISGNKEKSKVDRPQDRNLEEAVARMTAAAQAEGRPKLVMSIEEWQSLVVAYMKANKFMQFSQEVVKRIGEVVSPDDVNRWLGLAMNIWNTTPQPDRGGKTAKELSAEGNRPGS